MYLKMGELLKTCPARILAYTAGSISPDTVGGVYILFERSYIHVYISGSIIIIITIIIHVYMYIPYLHGVHVINIILLVDIVYFGSIYVPEPMRRLLPRRKHVGDRRAIP